MSSLARIFGRRGAGRAGEYATGLAEMWRVIYALILREARTRHGSSDLGYAWAVIDPLAQMLVLLAVYRLFGRHVPVAASMPVFLVTGIMPYHFWRDSMSRSGTAVGANIPLLTYPQVRPADVIIARTILEAVTTVVVVLIFVFGLNLTTGEPFSSWLDEPVQILFAFTGIFYFGLGSAFLSSGLSRLFPIWNEIFSYTSRPLWFTSGIFFTMEALPPAIRSVAAYNPILHMIDWIRSATLPGYEGMHYSRFFVFATATIFLLVGLSIDRLLTVMGHTDEAH